MATIILHRLIKWVFVLRNKSLKNFYSTLFTTENHVYIAFYTPTPDIEKKSQPFNWCFGFYAFNVENNGIYIVNVDIYSSKGITNCKTFLALCLLSIAWKQLPKIHTFHLVIMKNTNVFVVVCCSDRIFLAVHFFVDFCLEKLFAIFSHIIRRMKMRVDTGWIKFYTINAMHHHWNEKCNVCLLVSNCIDIATLHQKIIEILIFFLFSLHSVVFVPLAVKTWR